jgi:ribonuclease P protein component
VKKINSLKGTKAFGNIFRRGKRFKGEGIQLIVLRTKNNGDRTATMDTLENLPDPNIRIGISINGKYGNAIIRNKAKRRIRAICRELLPALEEGYYIVLRPGTEFKTYGFDHARGVVRHMFHKAGILKR